MAGACWASWILAATLLGAEPPEGATLATELIFPLRADHNHAPGIVQFADGELMVSWYRGSGERRADDVAIYGARRPPRADAWSEPFVMADTPGFPDCNTCMMIDPQDRLWLFWPVVIANSWESCLTRYRISRQPQGSAAPRWDWQGIVLLKPADFAEEALQSLEAFLSGVPQELSASQQAEIQRVRDLLSSKLHQRLGWQPRCKPIALPTGRLVLPLYSDTYSMSIMAISDDQGDTWYASEPLIGWGNIQPTLLRRNDGTLVAYMRENGVTGRIRVAQSTDGGQSWGPVRSTDLPNPGSGLDGVRLADGNWLLVYNDTVQNRSRLAVSLSDDEGQTWRWTRHLERHEAGEYHYPAVIQGQDGRIHVVYSYRVERGQSMKHAVFPSAWVRQ